MASDALIEMIERKLEDYGLEKVVPDDETLAKTYRAFHRSDELREKFTEMATAFDNEAAAVEIPEDLQEQVRAVLDEHNDCAGTTQSRSCSMKRSSSACGRTSGRPKRNRATSRAPTKATRTSREARSMRRAMETGAIHCRNGNARLQSCAGRPRKLKAPAQ